MNTAPSVQGRVQTGRPSEFGDPSRARMMRQVSEDAPGKAGLFWRVYSSKGVSPRERVKAKCLECCWMDEAAIRECTSYACPLYEIRPYQDKRTAGPMQRGTDGGDV